VCAVCCSGCGRGNARSPLASCRVRGCPRRYGLEGSARGRKVCPTLGDSQNKGVLITLALSATLRSLPSVPATVRFSSLTLLSRLDCAERVGLLLFVLWTPCRGGTCSCGCRATDLWGLLPHVQTGVVGRSCMMSCAPSETHTPFSSTAVARPFFRLWTLLDRGCVDTLRDGSRGGRHSKGSFTDACLEHSASKPTRISHSSVSVCTAPVRCCLSADSCVGAGLDPTLIPTRFPRVGVRVSSPCWI
jgi:hypothetical protein